MSFSKRNRSSRDAEDWRKWKAYGKSVLLTELHPRRQFNILRGIYNSFAHESTFPPVGESHTIYHVGKNHHLWVIRMYNLISHLFPLLDQLVLPEREEYNTMVEHLREYNKKAQL